VAKLQAAEYNLLLPDKAEARIPYLNRQFNSSQIIILHMSPFFLFRRVNNMRKSSMKITA
jgi:hypothetical protein